MTFPSGQINWYVVIQDMIDDGFDPEEAADMVEYIALSTYPYERMVFALQFGGWSSLYLQAWTWKTFPKWSHV